MEKVMETPANVFPELFNAQKGLLDYYLLVESLPDYNQTHNMKEKQHQALLKDFMFRFMEELVESGEQLELAYSAISTNDLASAKKHVEAYNEEIADCTHFLLEILIYSNISVEDIDGWIEQIFRTGENELGMPIAFTPNRTLKNLYSLGFHLNQKQLPRIDTRVAFSVFSVYDAAENPFVAGGRMLSDDILTIHQNFLWAITSSTYKTSNVLKNKSWRKSEEAAKVNELQYRERLFKTLIVFIQYLQFSGITEIPLYQSYMRKNKINHERIKENY